MRVGDPLWRKRVAAILRDLRGLFKDDKPFVRKMARSFRKDMIDQFGKPCGEQKRNNRRLH